MTSAQLVLVSVTSALIAVFAMLVVATIRRARTRDEPEEKEKTRDGLGRTPEKNA